MSRVHPFIKDESIQQSLVQLRKIVTPIQSKPIKYEIYSKYFYMTYYLKSVYDYISKLQPTHNISFVKMARIALFGSSFIARLEEFCWGYLKVPGDVRFFGMGGMKFETCAETLKKVKSFKPCAVYIFLGGNSITKNTKPSELAAKVKKVYDHLQPQPTDNEMAFHWCAGDCYEALYFCDFSEGTPYHPFPPPPPPPPPVWIRT